MQRNIISYCNSYVISCIYDILLLPRGIRLGVQLLAGSQDTLALQWYVLSTVARPSAFGRGAGLGAGTHAFASITVGMFRGGFLCPHSFSLFTVCGNAHFGLLIILPVARL